jgi:hypothetical protein
MKWFRMDIPTGWGQIVVRTVVVAVVAFIVMQAKEYLDAGQFDTLGTAADALLIAGGVLIVYAILMLAIPGRKLARETS